MCLTARSPDVRRLAVTRRHGSAGRYRAGTVCSIAGSSIVRRLVVTRRNGSAGRLPDGQCARLLGTRRLVGPGANSRPGSAGQAQCASSLGARRLAGRTQACGGLCLPSSVSAAGAAHRPARDWTRPTLSWNIVANGPSQSPWLAGPAEQPGPAGQSAGQIHGGARCRAPSRFRQLRGTAGY
jgi:hypothetical protein